MLKKLFTTTAGIGCVLGALFAALCTTMAIGDITSGEVGKGVGLMIFFGGSAALMGWGAVRLLIGKRSSPVEQLPTTSTSTSSMHTQTIVNGIDIALEARLLRVAQSKGGRVTPIEVALECGTSIDVATAALDQLVMRGHAELAVADEGSTLYVLRGFLSVAEKAEAEVVLG